MPGFNQDILPGGGSNWNPPIDPEAVPRVSTKVHLPADPAQTRLASGMRQTRDAARSAVLALTADVTLADRAAVVGEESFASGFAIGSMAEYSYCRAQSGISMAHVGSTVAGPAAAAFDVALRSDAGIEGQLIAGSYAFGSAVQCDMPAERIAIALAAVAVARFVRAAVAGRVVT